MEIWLLGAGAIVLVAITLWIVWPARSADLVGTSALGEEVSKQAMTETLTSGLPPQGDRFEDQYTSATADLSAGGVAAALDSMQDTPAAPPAVAAAPYATPDRPDSFAQAEEGSRPRRRVSLGVGAALALGGGIAGAWLYARWQRERNKPLNRLRRGVRDVASRLSERIPDVDELPRGAAPMSGAATALLLAAVVASRALHRETPTDSLRGSVEDLKQRGRKQSASLPAAAEARKPAVMGMGMGGMALVVGGALAVWRLLRRGQPDRSAWYAGQ